MNFSEARHNMVNQQVKTMDVKNSLILSVLEEIPREIFVPPKYQQLAYADTDIPLMEGQTMLPPKTVGCALQALDIKPDESVLEIGTGTGYTTACLGRLAKQVTSIEIWPDLAEVAKRNLENTRESSNILLKVGNGVEGYHPGAPYDVIIATGAFPLGVPETLCAELKDGGRLFAICGQAPAMRAILLTKNNEKVSTEFLFETVVPPLLKAATPAGFVF